MFVTLLNCLIHKLRKELWRIPGEDTYSQTGEILYLWTVSFSIGNIKSCFFILKIGISYDRIYLHLSFIKDTTWIFNASTRIIAHCIENNCHKLILFSAFQLCFSLYKLGKNKCWKKYSNSLLSFSESSIHGTLYIIISISFVVLLNYLYLNPRVLPFVRFSFPSYWEERRGVSERLSGA